MLNSTSDMVAPSLRPVLDLDQLKKSDSSRLMASPRSLVNYDFLPIAASSTTAVSQKVVDKEAEARRDNIENISIGGEFRIGRPAEDPLAQNGLEDGTKFQDVDVREMQINQNRSSNMISSQSSRSSSSRHRVTREKEKSFRTSAPISKSTTVLTLNDEDETITSLPVNYFDWNEKSFFVERQKTAVTRLQRKGNVIYEEGEVLSMVSSEALSVFNEDERSEVADILKNLNRDEIGMFSGLDSQTQEEILSSLLKSSWSAANVASKLVSMARMRGHLKGLSVEYSIGNIQDRSVELNIKSTASGLAHVLLLKTSSMPVGTVMTDRLDSDQHDLYRYLVGVDNIDVAKLADFQVVKSVRSQVIAEQVIQMQLKDLNMSTAYNVMIFIKTSEGNTTMKMDAFLATTQTFVTLPEDFSINWNSVNDDHKVLELRTASMSIVVQKLSETSMIEVPDSDDLDAYSKSLSFAAFSSKSSVNKVKEFIDWWTRTPAGINARKCFLFQEVLYSLQDDGIADYFNSLQILSSAAFSDLRKNVQTLVRDPSYNLDEKLLRENSNYLKDFISSQEFEKYRSWYKAGIVLENFAKEELGRFSPLGTNATPKSLQSPQSTKNSFSFRASKMQKSKKNLVQYEARTNKKTFKDYIGERHYHRSIFLQSRVELLNECKLAVLKLIDGCRLSDVRGLHERDLIQKKSQLCEEVCTSSFSLSITQSFYQDVNAILSKKRLKELCIMNGLIKSKKLGDRGNDSSFSMTRAKLDSSKLGTGEFTWQAIAGLDPFQTVNILVLQPPIPPSINMNCLPGTNRRPHKPWQLCTPEEQTLELMLSSTLTDIVDEALTHGIIVPEPEDAFIDKKLAPATAMAWEEYKLWYAGNEETDSVPGHPVPSVARVLFAENWETGVVKNDIAVVRTMQALGIPLPGFYDDDSDDDDDEVIEAITLNDSLFDSSAGMDGLMDTYESYIQVDVGKKMRIELMLRYLTVILNSRRSSCLFFLYPPGPNRPINNFMFPPMSASLMLLPMEMPDSRIQVFPSMSTASYTLKDICIWYDDGALQDDDVLMLRAESLGIRRRAYNDWLALEHLRVKYSQESMIQEDIRAHMDRTCWRNIESNIKLHESRLLGELYSQEGDGFILEPESDNNHDIDAKLELMSGAISSGLLKSAVFSDNIPKDLDVSSYKILYGYRDGNGIDNNDEIDDALMEMQKSLESAKMKEDSLQAKIREERLQMERDAEARRKKTEGDQRMFEGIERRRLIRERLDEIKKQRMLAALEAQEKEEMESQLRTLLYLQQQEKEAIELEELRMQQWENYESKLMNAEDLKAAEIQRQIEEIEIFEHEDILAVIYEEVCRDAEEKREAHLQRLKEVYDIHSNDLDHEKLRYRKLNELLTDPNSFFEGGGKLSRLSRTTLRSRRSRLPRLDINLEKTMNSTQKRPSNRIPIATGLGKYLPAYEHDKNDIQARVRLVMDSDRLKMQQYQRQLSLASLSAITTERRPVVASNDEPIDYNDPRSVMMADERRMLLDPKTRIMSVKANDLIKQIQTNRSAINSYVDTLAVLEDNEYFQSHVSRTLPGEALIPVSPLSSRFLRNKSAALTEYDRSRNKAIRCASSETLYEKTSQVSRPDNLAKNVYGNTLPRDNALVAKAIKQHHNDRFAPRKEEIDDDDTAPSNV